MRNNAKNSFLTAYLWTVTVAATAILALLSLFGFYLKVNDSAFAEVTHEITEDAGNAGVPSQSLSLDAEFLFGHLDSPLCEFDDFSSYENYLSGVGETRLVRTGEDEYTVATSEGIRIVDFTMNPDDRREPLPENAENIVAYAERAYALTAAVLPESELFVNGIPVSDKYRVKNDGVYGIYAIDGLAAEPDVKIYTDGRECTYTVDEHDVYIEDYVTVEKHPSDKVTVGGEEAECYVLKNGIDGGFETVRVTGYADISDIKVESTSDYPAYVGDTDYETAENDEELYAEYAELAKITAEEIAQYISNDIGIDKASRNVDVTSELYRTMRLLEVNWFTSHTDSVIKNGTASEFVRISDSEFSCRYAAVQTVTLPSGQSVDIPIDFTLFFRDTESGPLAYNLVIN